MHFYKAFCWLLLLGVCINTDVYAQGNSIFRQVDGVQENSQVLPSLQEQKGAVEKRPLVLSDFKAPSNAVVVKDNYKGIGEKTIILIQDAHCNAEAQVNIAKIVKYAAENYGVRLLCVEGSVGNIDVTMFREHPDPNLVRDCIAFFMRKGRLTGPEMYAIQSQYVMYLYGIEDEALYDLNLNAFKKTMPLRSEFFSGIASFEKAMNKLAPRVNGTNVKLTRFQNKIKEFEEDESKFSEHGNYLADKIKELEISSAQFPNLMLFAKVAYYEKRVDFDAVNKERNDLTDALLKNISSRYADELRVKSDYYISGKLTTGQFYTYLINLSRRYKMNLDVYPNLHAYQIYMSAYEKLNHDGILSEMIEAERAIGQALAETQEQKQLDAYSRALRKLKNFYKLEMSHYDLDYYNSHREDFSAARIYAFLGVLANRYGVRLNIPTEAVNLDGYYPVLNDFYKYAVQRDMTLADKTLEKMEDMNVDIAIQVCGGFHTEGITRILRERKISYITVAPRITKEGDPEVYLDVLLSRTSYLDHYGEFSEFREEQNERRERKREDT